MNLLVLIEQEQRILFSNNFRFCPKKGSKIFKLFFLYMVQ
jgi:hypothetical protein